MKLKKLIGILVVGTVGFFGYKFLVTNFSSEAMVYKRFANAVIDGESSRIKTIVSREGNAMDAFQARKQRQELINGEVRFTWYEFKDKRVSPDGDYVNMTIVQNMRVDPPGEDTFYGTEVRKDRHTVTLKKNQSSWLIEDFEDTPTSQYRAEKASPR